MMYDQVISLGLDCQPAYHIKNTLHNPGTHYFDWLVTPVPALLWLFSNGLDKLCKDRAQFETVETASTKKCITVKHKDLGVVFFHDFLMRDQLNAFDSVVSKYKYLSQCWEMDMVGQILFIRHYAKKDEAIQIQQSIKARYPNITFDLLVVNEGNPDPDWHLPGIFDKWVGATTTDWRGDVVGWNRICREMRLI